MHERHFIRSLTQQRERDTNGDDAQEASQRASAVIAQDSCALAIVWDEKMDSHLLEDFVDEVRPSIDRKVGTMLCIDGLLESFWGNRLGENAQSILVHTAWSKDACGLIEEAGKPPDQNRPV